LTWNLRVKTDGFPLLRHNVFFSADYAAEFKDMIDRGQLPKAPTVYVCAQDRGEPAAHQQGQPERLLCLVNAPATSSAEPPTTAALDAYRAFVLGGLARYGLQLDPDAAGTIQTTPSDFERLFPGSSGALYGRASHGWTASFARPGARSRVDRLYLAGGTTHPGPGVPMAALSGRLAAASVQADLGSALRRGSA
jgi:1-hydroxycarotenoid 3,4-desaturase